MDKTEYRMKLDEINRLVEAQDYEGALEIADAIEWKRVKSVRTLCMVADIYEVNGELEESMKILQLAYKRSSVGKMILYRQVELALKMGNYDEAVKYYNQYLETASNDTSKYILKYKIYKAKNAPLEEQIAILEEYKEKEYTERWVYELARLYKKAGMKTKCIETCDDLVLWFGEGKYVTRAMEMKMEYVPLNPSQQLKYDRKKEAQKQEAAAPKQESVPEQKETTENTDAMAEAAVTEEPKEELPELPDIPSVREPQMQIDTAQLQEKLAKSFQEVLAGLNRTKVVDAFEALGRASGSELPKEELPEEENIEGYQVSDLEPEEVNEAKISAEKAEETVQRKVVPEMVEKEEKPEEKLEDKEITSVHDVDLEALFAETSDAFLKEIGDTEPEEEMLEEEEPTEETSEEVSEEEILTEESSKEEAPAEEAAMEEVSMEEDQSESEDEMFIPEIEMSVVDEVFAEAEAEKGPEKDPEEADDFDCEVANGAAEAAMAAFEASILSDLEELGLTDEKEPEVKEVVLNVDEPEEEPEAEEVVLNVDEPEEEPEVEEVVLNVDEPEEEPEAEEVVLNVDEPEEEPEVEEVVLNVDEPEEEPEVEEVVLNVDEPEEESEAEELPEIRLYEPETEIESEEKKDLTEEDLIPDLDMDLVMEMTQDEEEEEAETEATQDEPEDEPTEDDLKVETVSVEELEREEPTEQLEMPEQETPEEKRIRILNDTRPERLSDSQKRLFSYFAKVPGMDQQILDAINGVYAYADEKTSRHGNIAIMGSHGTGKTRLSEGLVKAICKELGLEAAKYANLDASDMNSKDPAAIIAKMAGGFLLIERAGHMTPDTIQKLSQAMDFRTDSMILIIEDDKASMRKLLADYPEFAKKFETVISIPVFTNDELVTFARTYAKENGYRMEEMGVLALYTLIGDNQREDEPITIGKVKEMVDGAIQRAGGIRRKISKRRKDADGRILLYEKDFDL